MREIKLDRIADGYAEGLKLPRTFQVLSTHLFIARESGGTVVFLCALLLLEHCSRFCFVLEELAVSTFADSRPGDTPQRSSASHRHLFEFDCSLAHSDEILRKDALFDNYSSTRAQSRW